MIHKLLIANRGEVAMRILRTAKHLGLGTVAVHSEADARALHVLSADERVAIGPAAATESYLKIEQILRAAEDTGADAVHPGYGFLSESAELATLCRAAGLVFIGPSQKVIRAVGRKDAARRAAIEAGVPVVPGSEPVNNPAAALAAADALGLPVLIKAARGGGGLAMLRVDQRAEVAGAYERVRTAARAAFGDDTVYLEKWLAAARHVEVQIAADAHGGAIHLGARECSVQRRHQKVLEETPCPNLSPAMHEAMTDAALRLVRHVGYDSLGTVEMLVQGGAFYFLEMNSRLQVAHSVTEMVTGLDLVEWQVHLAIGESLPVTQDEIECTGHAIQCRIYAEDPERGFAASPGRISRFAVPTGPWVRNDVGVLEGEYVTPYYDPMIAKLIVHGADRDEALARMRAALNGYLVEGIQTNLDLHRVVLNAPAFVAGRYDTTLLGQLGFLGPAR